MPLPVHISQLAVAPDDKWLVSKGHWWSVWQAPHFPYMI